MPAGSRATMDFFAAQAAARRRTAVLVVYFALAWAATIAIVYAGLGLVLSLHAFQRVGAARALAFGPGLLAATAAGVTLVTACGSAYHAMRLARDGGHGVARMVGGVPVDRGTSDPAERRLLNVVEEMAIASGLPVPTVYVLPDDRAINAFAAGFAPEQSVVAVTRGAVDLLTRDELQGVVAHELSHVLNGDARLNLRLLALIGGITVLALAGRFLAREVGGGPRSRVGGRGRAGIALVGVCLWVAGSVGAFFGRLIRAAVSRQREFLADAAAVQFTRNPDGLAGALAKVALSGSAVSSAQAPELAHLFFANGLSSRLLASHPPIAERIERISPHGVLRASRIAAAQLEETARAPAAEATIVALAGDGEAASQPSALVASAGRPEPRHLAYAAGLLARVPAEIAAACREPRGASALVRALLVDPDPAARGIQVAALPDPFVRTSVDWFAGVLGEALREHRMGILDLALPALDALPREDATALVRDLAILSSADGRTTIFEWAVQRIVRRRLSAALGERTARPPRARTVDDVQVETLELLSTLAWVGARDPAAAQAAVDAGTAALGVRATWHPLPRDRISAARLEAALARLDGADLALKGRLVAACAACALADGVALAAEAEVVRAVAASLGVPLPPLVSAEAARAAGAA